MSLHKSNTAWSWCLDGRHHLIYVITTAIGWAIPSGPTEVANVYRVVWSLPSCFRRTRLYVIGWTIPHVCTRMERYPVAWNLSPCCLLFLHNTVANMLCRLFDDCKYIDIYLPIPQEYCYIGKQKSLYFLVSTCEHLWPSHLLNFSNWLIGDIFTGFVRTFCAVLKKTFIKFQSH